MIKALKSGLLSAVALILAAGSTFAAADPKNPPGPEAFEDKLTDSLPSFWKVGNIEILGKANRGDAVDPRWVYRFQGAVAPRVDLFVEDSSENGVTFVRPAASAGTKKELYGKARATIEDGEWDLAFTEVDGAELIGNPKATFSGRVLLAGSEEAEAYRDQRVREAVDAYKSELEKKTQKLKADHQAELEQLRDQHADKVARLEAKIENAKKLKKLNERLSKVRDDLAKSEAKAVEALEKNIDRRQKIAERIVDGIEGDSAEKTIAALETVKNGEPWLFKPVVAKALNHSSERVRGEAMVYALESGDAELQREALKQELAATWQGRLLCPDNNVYKQTWRLERGSDGTRRQVDRIQGVLSSIGPDDAEPDKMEIAILNIRTDGGGHPTMRGVTRDDSWFDYDLEYKPGTRKIVGHPFRDDYAACQLTLTRS